MIFFPSDGRCLRALAPCDCAATLAEAVSLAEKQGRRQNVKISTDLPPSHAAFQLDAGADQDLLPQHSDQCHSGDAAREARCRSPPECHRQSKARSFCNCAFADTGPGIPSGRPREGFYAFLFHQGHGLWTGIGDYQEDRGGPRRTGFRGRGDAPGTVVVIELPVLANRDMGVGVSEIRG